MAGYLGSIPVPQATQHRESFTATAGQTTFNTAGYTVGFVDVYLNGVHLTPADVTATNGSDVVIGACLVNDIVDVISYTAFEVANQTFTGTTILDGAVVINESSADVDFRVESNGNTHALFVEGSNGNVGIGTTPSGNLTAGYNLRLNGGSQTFLAFNNTTHTTQVLGGFAIGNDASAVYITQRENQPIIIATNDTERMRIDSAGAVTMPSQPAFQAHKNGTDQTNFPAGAADVTVTWSNEAFDQNADFDLSNNRFVAPVTGKYQLNLMLRLENIDSASDYYVIRITTSNQEYSHLIDPDYGQDNAYYPVQISVLADMDASDTATVKVSQQSATVQTDIDGNRAYTNFSGYLVA